MAPCGHDLFNQLLRVRGMVPGLTDLLLDEDFAEAFLERLMHTHDANEGLAAFLAKRKPAWEHR